MKLRRAMAAAAATAVIAPLALLAAPAAYADEDTPSSQTTTTTADPSSSTSEEPSTTPSDDETTGETTEPAPSDSESTAPTQTESSTPDPTSSESTPATTSPSPSTSAPEESETPVPEPSVCEDTKVDVSISGLPGKIAAGSGWHKFSLNVANNSDSTLEDLDYFAGASSDADGENLFKNKQVSLQAWNPDDKVWEDLNETDYAAGYVGYTDVLEPDYEVNIPMRVNVKANAPVGAGFTLGATIYGDSDGECFGYGDVAYKFQIVAAGTNTDGTKPTEGGKAPVTNEKPAATTPEVTGSLAETGSSSALPMIGLAGGLAVLVGGGAVFVVRRRKTGAEA